jgi:glutamate-ammonia-ligase adenylyltransferase
MAREQLTLTDLARVGFADLGEARARLDEVGELGGPDPSDLFPLLSRAANPDAALFAVLSLVRQAPAEFGVLRRHAGALQRLVLVTGASTGLTDFFLRHPGELAVLHEKTTALAGPGELTDDLLDAVRSTDGFAALLDDDGWVALRVRYRRRRPSWRRSTWNRVTPSRGSTGSPGAWPTWLLRRWRPRWLSPGACVAVRSPRTGCIPSTRSV